MRKGSLPVKSGPNSESWASVGWEGVLTVVVQKLCPSTDLARAVQLSFDRLQPNLQRQRAPRAVRSRRARQRRSVWRAACHWTCALWVVEQWLCYGGVLPKGELPALKVGSPDWRRLYPRCHQLCRLRLWEGLEVDKRGRLEELAQKLLDVDVPTAQPLGRVLQGGVLGYCSRFARS